MVLVKHVINIVNEVCEIMVEQFWTDFAEKLLPITEAAFHVKMQGMEAEWQFLYVFSAIDGSYIPIKCPPGDVDSVSQWGRS